MEQKRPIIEGNRARADIHHLRLMALLQELERDHGRKKAAAILGVDRRTLDASLDDGVLSRRMRGALDRALRSGAGSVSDDRRERNDRLDDVEAALEDVKGKIKALAEDVSKGFAAVRGDVKALRDDHGRRLTQLEGGGGPQDDGEETKAAGGPATRREARWRKFPDLVTREPVEGDEKVFGAAWPLISEWRELKKAHPIRGKGFAWLTDHERLLEMELALLLEHGMTLPPEKQPLRGFDRGGQVNWRRSALANTWRALLWRRRMRRVLRAVTFRPWR